MSHPLQNPDATVNRRGQLGFLAVTLMCFLAASSAPTPLYHLYQQSWGFSSAILTLIFASYVLSLLVALLVVGSLSDYVGRRPVIFAALLLEVIAMGLFIEADSVGWLLAARSLQGVATGMATSALGAAILDVDQRQGPVINSVTPLLGMAFGALGTSVLVAFAPWPMLLAFVVLLIGFALQALGIWRLPETVSRQPGVLASLRPSLHVPPQARRTLWLVLPVSIAAWALGGFYMSLAPSLLAAATGSTSVLNGGLAVAALAITGSLSMLYLRQSAPNLVLLLGTSFLIIGVGVILVAVNSGWLWLFFLGTVIAGWGFGAGFMAALRLLLPLAHAHERAGLMSAFLALSYLAFCIPSLIAGLSARTYGLIATTNVYGLVVILLALLALSASLVRRSADSSAVQQH